MTDFTSFWPAGKSGFTHAVGWEVVMQQEIVSIGSCQRIDNRCITHRAQCCGDNRLGFTASKHCRPVGLIQKSDFDTNITNGFGIATINSWLTRDDSLPNGLFLQFPKSISDLIGFNTSFLISQCIYSFIAQFLDAILSLHLVNNLICLADTSCEFLCQSAG